MKFKNKAFTLVELLVTVALVGILSAMALAQFQTYRAKANDSVALGQLVNVRTAVEAQFISNMNLTGTTIFGGDGSVVTLSGSVTSLPGYRDEPHVAIWLHVGPGLHFGGTPGIRGSYSIWAAHCLGTITSNNSGNTVMLTYETNNISMTSGSVRKVGAGGFIKGSEMFCPTEDFY